MRKLGQPIVDEYGREMFYCSNCGAAMTDDDFFELNMRLPDRGESRDDYCEAELVEHVQHMRCGRAYRAG